MDPKPDVNPETPPAGEPADDRVEQLRREADANAAGSAQLARHIRTFAQGRSPPSLDEHWKPALPFDPKA